MCQRIYIASRAALPVLTQPADRLGLRVGPLSNEAAAVRRWFSSDAAHFAEALASPCGCGFPEVNEPRPGRPVEKDEARAMQALTEYLDALDGRRYVAELLLCWVGDESQRPGQRREVPLDTLRAEGFRFRRGEVLRIRRS